MNFKNLTQREKIKVFVSVILALSVFSGLAFTMSYTGKPEEREVVETVVVEEAPEVIEEDATKTEELAEETEKVEEEQEEAEEVREQREATREHEEEDSFGDHVGEAVDKGVVILKGGADWLGEKLTEWGESK